MKDDWQTMDTAPKEHHQRVFGVNAKDEVTVMYCAGKGRVGEDEWIDLCDYDVLEGCHDFFYPVAWMHLPKPPERK